MRRYLFSSENVKNDGTVYDAVIVGGGLAGLYCALCIDPKFKVALISKGGIDSGSSWLAQGGIAAVTQDSDSFEDHIKDTLTAGAGHCDRQAVEVLVKEGPKDIEKMIELGVPFDKDADGNIIVTREGGHCCRRILHCGGDATGKLMTKTLGQVVSERENIDVYFNTFLVDVLTDENGASGVVVNDGKCDRAIFSRNVVIATGAVGQLYKYSTNPGGATGDGIAAGMRAGAVCKDMEFVQFHPTALAAGIDDGKMFLISEAVRGEGGILKNSKDEAFMHDKHSLMDLAPRDIVTREILKEMKRTGDECAYLDVSSMDEEFFSKRFPTIFAKCRSLGINVPYDKIPVVPTEHYFMGGIRTDLKARTAVSGLYACGEAACTGVQGANRLASNSTLECLVFGRRAAETINADFRPVSGYDFKVPETAALSEKEPELSEVSDDIAYMKEIMTQKAGPVRRMSELEDACAKLEKIYAKYEGRKLSNIEEYTVFNAASASLAIAESALSRKQSIGAHYVVE